MTSTLPEIPEFTPVGGWKIFQEATAGKLTQYLPKDREFWIEKNSDGRYVIMLKTGRQLFEKIPLDVLEGLESVGRVGVGKKGIPHYSVDMTARSVFARTLVSEVNAIDAKHYLCVTVEYAPEKMINAKDRVITVSLFKKGEKKKGEKEVKPSTDGSAHGNNYY